MLITNLEDFIQKLQQIRFDYGRNIPMTIWDFYQEETGAWYIEGRVNSYREVLGV